MNVGTAPGKNLIMQAIMLWLTGQHTSSSLLIALSLIVVVIAYYCYCLLFVAVGNSLHIFSLMMLAYMLFNPLKGLAAFNSSEL